MNRCKKFIWIGIAAIAIGGFATFHVGLNSQGTESNVVLFLNGINALSTVECTTTENKTNLLTTCTGQRSTADGIKKKKYCTVDGGACSYSSNGTGS
jgi:hypothetical protein